MTLPAWLINDTDERAELLALGAITVEDNDDGELVYLAKGVSEAVLASMYMQRAHAITKEIEQLDANKRREIIFIESRFDRMTDALKKSLAQLDAAIKAIAQLVIKQDAKKKSIGVGYGTVGMKKSRASIEIVDKEQAVEWAKKNCFGALVVTVSMPYRGWESVKGLIDIYNARPATVDRQIEYDIDVDLKKTPLAAYLDVQGIKKMPGVVLHASEDEPFYKIDAPA